MKIGYARVSATHQNLERQLDALQREGCDRIFSDKSTGADLDRPGWQQCWDYLREGDELIVWSCDRIGRNFDEMLQIISQMKERGIKLKSISEPMIDTSSTTGELIFRIIMAVADWQRSYILEQAAEGRAAAKARGRSGGRPRKLSDEQIESAETLRQANKKVSHICKSLDISRATYYRRIHN